LREVRRVKNGGSPFQKKKRMEAVKVTSTLDRVGNEELDLPGPVQQSKASNYTSIKSAVLDNGQAYV